MANPFAPPEEKKSLAPFYWGTLGFLAVNALLTYPKCGLDRRTGWHCDPSVNSSVAVAVLAVAIGLVVLAGRGGAGRRFAWGFILTLVAVATLTWGEFTFAWAEPVRAFASSSRPYRNSVSEWKVKRGRRKVWVGLMNGRQPVPLLATDLAAQVYQCATGRVEGPLSPEIPRSEGEISTHCSDLWPNSASADTVKYPDRYRVPEFRSAPEEPSDSTRTPWDEGWRWTFSTTRSAAGARLPPQFDVTIAPDEYLAYGWPRVNMDERGLMRIVTGAGATPLTVSPVPDLLLMHECLQGIPAEHERRTRGRLFAPPTWSFPGMVQVLCPRLAARVGLVDLDSEDAMLTVELPVGPRGSPAKVARYHVSIGVDETLPSFGFSLIATSINETRHFLVTPDGAVHVTSEPRLATTDDPGAERCEVTLDAPC